MFIEIPAASFDSVFSKAGFTKSTSNREVTYERPHRDPRFKIVIYTSLTVGEEKTRAKGSDAIRAALVQTLGGKTRGVDKSKSVYRDGTPDRVLERTLERARQMWASANELSKVPACKCGSARYADSGRCISNCGA